MRQFITKLLLAMAFIASAGLSGSGAALAAGDLLSSTFPVHLFTRNITQGSDTFEIELMIRESFGCPHDYAPTPGDLERLSQADVLIINGMGLDAFLQRSLRVAKDGLQIVDASGNLTTPSDGENPAIPVVSRQTFMSTPSAIGRINPHLFASPSTASAMVRNIAEGLAAIDPPKAALYRTNAARLIGELETTAKSMRLAGQTLGNPKIIASHNVFQFLADDMGLNIVAYIEEHEGHEPSAARMTELVKLAQEQGVQAIMVDPAGGVNVARTLGAEAKVPVVVIDPVSSGPLDAPLDYYQKVMLTNTQVLVELFAKPQSTEAGPKK